MGARVYDPQLGRWLSPDSIIPDYKNPQNLNRYSYVLGNPIRLTDSTGHCSSCVEIVKSLVTQISDFTNNQGASNPNTQHSGSVISFSATAGGRLLGVGPIFKQSVDIITTETGGVGIYYTRSVGGWEGLVSELTSLDSDYAKEPFYQFMNEMDFKSFMVPQVSYSVSTGSMEGGYMFLPNGEQKYVPYHYSDYVGYTANLEGSHTTDGPGIIGAFLGSSQSYSFIGGSVNNGWKDAGWTDGVTSKALGWGVGLPLSAAYYPTESQLIVGGDHVIQGSMLEICKVVGQCGGGR